MLDGIVIANELVQEAKQKNRPCMEFNANFEKAYNSIGIFYITW